MCLSYVLCRTGKVTSIVVEYKHRVTETQNTKVKFKYFLATDVFVKQAFISLVKIKLVKCNYLLFYFDFHGSEPNIFRVWTVLDI